MADYLLLEGDTLEMLREMEDESVDSVVTDPPYGIAFMNKKWDYDIPKVDVWQECLRVLKPGGHMLVACGTRTQHRMVVNIEDAGFEIRDVITWHYGSGFPKSMDISKAIDKKFGAEREVVGVSNNGSGAQPSKLNNHDTGDTGIGYMDGSGKNYNITTPSTDEAKKYDGWGTALKPATEFWTLCRKPLSEKTVADNVLKYGTGGLNINVCRVEMSKVDELVLEAKSSKNPTGKRAENVPFVEGIASKPHELGRFPANLILDDFAAEQLDQQSGVLKSGKPAGNRNTEGGYHGKFGSIPVTGFGDSGGASRFFYVAKPSKKERNAGLENNHPTVKPIQLMQYLIRLITPKDGTVLDPYNGSGTTGCGAMLEGITYIGIDREADYIKISEARIEHYKKESEIITN